MTIHIHPARLLGMQVVPEPAVVLASARVEDGRGTLDVYVPQHEAVLRPLFEQPLQVAGQVLAPWSPEALQRIVDHELPRLAFAVSVVRRA